MELRVLGGALWRQRLLVLLILLIVGLAAAIGLRLAPKTYSSTATVSVAAAEPTSGSQVPGSELLLATTAALANSDGVVREVRTQLAGEVGAARSVEDLRQSISAEWIEGTELVAITATDTSPVVAAQIANLVADQGLPRSSPAGSFTTRTAARPATTYSSPDLLLSGGVGLALAGILAACAALVRDHRTHTVDDASAVEEAAVAPLLAHVAMPGDPTTLPALYPGTEAAEVFRHLRLAVEVESSRATAHRVVVAGVGAGEVNVWLGANLAVSLAKVGRRSLLIDGRLGEPEGARDAERPEALGLSDVLWGVDLDDALSQGPVDLLTVLPAGGWRGDRESARDLLDHHFADVIADAEARFDMVVVIAPPLDRSDDARLMAVGGLLLLAVPEGGVSAAALRAHANRVRAVGARLLGTVLVGRRAERTVA